MQVPAQPPELPGKALAEGRIALVYPWGEGHVLKLARDWVPPDWLEYEFRIANIVHESGLSMPRPDSMLTVDGRPGIVYTRVDGPTMLVATGSAPHRAIAFGRTLGQLHAEVHRRPGPAELPDNKDRLRSRILDVAGAPEPARKTTLDALERLPAGSSLLHGDFHPGNVILSASGPVVIDWVDASRGHPLSDVARTVVLSALGGLPSQPLLRILVGALRRLFKRAYLQAYFETAAYRRSELNGWMLPVLFARLSEDIPEEQPAIIRQLKKLTGHH